MSSCRTLMALMRTTFYLNRKLILWLAIGFGLLFLFTANTGPAFSPLYGIGLFVGGGLLSIGVFKELHDSGLSVQYLMLPVSAWMRYISAWLLTGPIYLLGLTALYEVAILAHMFGGTFWGFNDPGFILFATWYYLMFNAFLLLGSVYFKKLPLVKTLCCLLVVAIILVVLRNTLINMGWWYIDSWVRDGMWSFLAVVAWIFGYRSLKKVELK